MDIPQLQYFLAVARAGSFSAAAESVRIAQSALSRQVALLESELGTQLFDRTARGVALTEAGSMFQARVQSILGQLADARQEAIARADEPVGEVGIAIPPSLRNFLTTRVISQFRKAHPGVYFRVAEGTTQQSREMLMRGEADIALISTIEDGSDLTCTPLLTEALMLVGPRDCGLRLDKPIPVADLASVPLIVTPRPNSLRRIIDDALRADNLKANASVEATLGGLITDLVSQVGDYTVLPYSGVRDEIRRGTVAAAPISSLNISWLLARVRGRPETVAARRLSEMLRALAAELVDAGDWPTARLNFKA